MSDSPLDRILNSQAATTSAKGEADPPPAADVKETMNELETQLAASTAAGTNPNPPEAKDALEKSVTPPLAEEPSKESDGKAKGRGRGRPKGSTKAKAVNTTGLEIAHGEIVGVIVSANAPVPMLDNGVLTNTSLTVQLANAAIVPVGATVKVTIVK